ncbi:SsgA family sporulation/cell division regulator [Streptomyces sp. NPDC050504]|uniref:SsgA family sporulation/cell division regulator n=1 Tax=Streptomyces sp. NPDC050504 TaxID=3365618 RepID=UPI003797FFA6
MSGYQPAARTGRSARPARPRLTLDIERLLDVSARQPIRAEFGFDPDTPSAVWAEFGIAGGPCVRWRIGRDLLRRGLYERSGTGDVQVWPSPVASRATAWLQLASDDMAALFELPVPPLAEWLDHTYAAVPASCS